MNKLKALAFFLVMTGSYFFLIIGFSYCCEVIAAPYSEIESKRDAIVQHKQRIIALGGDITEIIYALHAEQQLIGVDTTSKWPKSAQLLPQVGYFRALSAEGVLSLSPDLLIMSEAAGPSSVIEQIKRTGTTAIKIKSERTPQGVMSKVRQIAQILSVPERGEQLILDIQTDINQLEQLKKRWRKQPRVAFLFSISKGAVSASGRDTAADAMIKHAGGINVFAGYSGYKPVNDEALIVADPEYILLTDHTVNMMGGLDKILNLSAVSLTTAAKQHRIIVMDTLYLLGFGPRTGEALLDLSQQLHQITKAHIEYE